MANNPIKFQPVMGSAAFINGITKTPGQLIVNLETGALSVVGPNGTEVAVGGVSKAVADEIERVLAEIEEAEY